MIVVDTSALMAIVMNEPVAPLLARAIEGLDQSLLISAGTVAEAMIVAAGRDRIPEMQALLEELDHSVVTVDEATSRRIVDAYRNWGKGFHPAGLNLGDCFAYALAKERDLPLLFVGNDFSQTDIKSALDARGDPS